MHGLKGKEDVLKLKSSKIAKPVYIIFFSLFKQEFEIYKCGGRKTFKNNEHEI